MNYLNYLDRDAINQFEYFITKVNENWEYKFGLRENYQSSDPALAPSVEYFGVWTTSDDRMRYIIENIVTLDHSKLSLYNKICNTIISHFYGVRGIHSIFTNEWNNFKNANIDFERILIDDEYLKYLKNNANIAKIKKMKLYGTTELHTSIQTASRNFCRIKYNDNLRPLESTSIIEWIASWIIDGTIDNIINAKTLQEIYNIVINKPGIGEYYAYHCAISNAINPYLKFNHDDTFVVPGPSAIKSLNYLFSPLKELGKIKKHTYSELNVFLSEYQDIIFNHPIKANPFFQNYIINDKKLFEKDQIDMNVYNIEICLCQFNVYRHLLNNPHLINKRKVSRVIDIY